MATWTTPNSGRASGYVVTNTNWNADQDNAQFLYDRTVAAPACRVHLASVSATGSGWSNIPFGASTEDWDDATNPIHSTSVNTTRMTIVVPGVYDVKAQAAFTAASGGNTRITAIFKNGFSAGAGTKVCKTQVAPVLAGFTDTVIGTSTEVALIAGDYLEMGTYQDFGAINLIATDTWFSVRWVSL